MLYCGDSVYGCHDDSVMLLAGGAGMDGDEGQGRQQSSETARTRVRVLEKPLKLMLKQGRRVSKQTNGRLDECARYRGETGRPRAPWLLKRN